MIHELGILHLDIKPQNIVVDGEKIFLIDFGESCVMETEDYCYSKLTGTLFYMNWECVNRIDDD